MDPKEVVHHLEDLRSLEDELEKFARMYGMAISTDPNMIAIVNQEGPDATRLEEDLYKFLEKTAYPFLERFCTRKKPSPEFVVRLRAFAYHGKERELFQRLIRFFDEVLYLYKGDTYWIVVYGVRFHQAKDVNSAKGFINRHLGVSHLAF